MRFINLIIGLALTGILISCLLPSCSGSGPNAFDRSRKQVIAAFGSKQVQKVPGYDFRWLIRKSDGSVWYAETLNLTNDSINFQSLIFPAPAKELSHAEN